MSLFCKHCGEEFTEEDFDSLQFVCGSPVVHNHPVTGEEVKIAFVEIRSCSRCGRDGVRRTIEYDPDVDPVTERNPVPTMRPIPEVR